MKRFLFKSKTKNFETTGLSVFKEPNLQLNAARNDWDEMNVSIIAEILISTFFCQIKSVKCVGHTHTEKKKKEKVIWPSVNMEQTKTKELWF